MLITALSKYSKAEKKKCLFKNKDNILLPSHKKISHSIVQTVSKLAKL